MSTAARQPDGWRLAAVWVARLIVAGLFVYTGYTKVLDPETFIKEVRAYELAPLQLSNLVAYILPWVEILAGLLLLYGFWRLEARVVLAVLLAVFVAAKAYLLLQGREFDCGCVPTDSALHVLFDGWTGVVTNLVLLALLGLEGGLDGLRRRRDPPPMGLPQPAPAPA